MRFAPYAERMRYGLGGAGLSFGAFQPTHDSDQVAEALRGHMPDDELRELAAQVTKAADRRRRKRKNSDLLDGLARLLSRASRPPALTGPTQVFDRPTGGEPLEVILMGGPTIGDRATVIPAGVPFVVPQCAGQVFVRPVDTDGPDGLVLTGADGCTVRISEEPSSGKGGYVAQVETPRAGGGFIEVGTP